MSITVYILLTILLAYASVLVLHFLVYLFFTLREDHETNLETGQKQPTVYYSYSSLVLKYFWKDVLLEKVMFHPFKSFKNLCIFFYNGYLKDKWNWLAENTWLGEKIYLYFLKRKGLKMLKEMERELKQKRGTR
jgi:hypothetical protein